VEQGGGPIGFRRLVCVLEGLEVRACVLLLICGFMLAVLHLDTCRGVLDEGIQAVASARWLGGEMPYRDYFLLAGPASVVTHSTPLLFGASFQASQWGAVAPLLILVGAICLHRVCWPVRLASVSAFMAIIFGADFRIYPNHRWDSAALAFAAFSLAARWPSHAWAAVSAGGALRAVGG
jgi:hypothetical protein